MKYAEPKKCPGSRQCPSGGSWGATGVLPPNHHWHFTEKGGYLAHGEPSIEDRDLYVESVLARRAETIATLDLQVRRKLAALGLTLEEVL